MIREAIASTSPAAVESYQRLRFEAQDANLTERIARLVPPSEAGHGLASLGETVLSSWPDATVDERNRMLRSVVRRGEVRHADRWRLAGRRTAA